MRIARKLAPFALGLGLLVPAFGGDGAADDVAAAVRTLVTSEDAAARDAARRTVAAHPAEAAEAFRQLAAELSAAREGTAVRAAGDPAAPGSGDGTVIRVYDVRDLVVGERTIEKLAEELRRAVPDAEVRVASGSSIVVIGPPERMVTCQERLDVARGDAGLAFRIELRVVRAPLTASLGATVSGARPGAHIALSDPAAQVDDWVRAGDAEVVTAPSLVTLAGQRATLQVGRAVSYVADFTTSHQDGGIIVEPVVEQVFDGLAVDMLPEATTDGGCAVDVTVTATDVDEPLDETEREVAGQGVRVQAPAWVRSEMRRRLALANGASALVRLPDADGRRAYLLVAVSRVEIPYSTDEGIEVIDLGSGESK